MLQMASGLSKVSRACSMYANSLISKMAITNTIHIEAHVGSVDDISVIWGANSVDNLSSNAEDYGVRQNVMEGSTKNVDGSAPTQKQQDDGPLHSQSRSKYNLKYLGHLRYFLPSLHPLPFVDALHSPSSYTYPVTFCNLYRWNSTSEIRTHTI